MKNKQYSIVINKVSNISFNINGSVKPKKKHFTYNLEKWKASNSNSKSNISSKSISKFKIEENINKFVKFEEDKNLNYFIKNNKINNKKKINLKSILEKNDDVNKSRMSIYDVKSLLNVTNKKEKIPSIKNIKIENLKSFLNQNLKISTQRKKKNIKRINSVKISFNKTRIKKISKKELNLNLIKNIKTHIQNSKKWFKLKKISNHHENILHIRNKVKKINTNFNINDCNKNLNSQKSKYSFLKIFDFK